MNFNGPEWCYLGLCAIAKRENEYLKEWVDYHVLVGVEHFVIYDNEEHPIAHRILKEYVDNGVVTVIHWPFKYAQLNVYQHCIDSYGKHFKWIGFIDLDEFLVPIQFNDLRAILVAYEDNPGIVVSSVVYGASGHVERPQKPQIEAYDEIIGPEDRHVKTILQPVHAMTALSPHHFKYKNNMLAVNEDGVAIHGPYTYNTTKRIRLNHYYYRSRSDWENKMHRGLAHPLKSGQSYRWEQFERHLPSAVQKSDLMHNLCSKLKDLQGKSAKDISEMATRYLNLSLEAWSELLRNACETVDASLAEGVPVSAETERLFILLPCYFSENPNMINMASSYFRVTGRIEFAWMLVRRSLSILLTPEGLLELSDILNAQNEQTKADVVKRHIGQLLEECGEMNETWSEMLKT